MKETTGPERFPHCCLTFFPSALDKIDNQANPTSDFRTGFASGRNESQKLVEITGSREGPLPNGQRIVSGVLAPDEQPETGDSAVVFVLQIVRNWS